MSPTANGNDTRKAARGHRMARALAGLPDEAASNRFFQRHARLADVGLARWLLDRSRELLRVDFTLAFAYADAARRVAERAGDPRASALALRAGANALSLAGNNLGAIDRHRDAIAAFERLGDEPELARTLSAGIQPLLLVGRYDEAIAWADRARRLFSSQGDEVRLARLDIMIGNLAHRQDRFSEALECYERAHRALAPLADADGLLSVMHNKAVTFTSLHDFHQALAAYRAARRLAEQRGLEQAITQTDYNIAWLHYLRGEYSHAIELLQQTAASARRTGDAYHAALSQLDLSEIYLELNLSHEALEMAEEANGRFDELGMGYEAAKALVNAAVAHGQQGQLVRALALFSAARDRMIREQNHVWPALIDLYRALLLADDGRVFEARRLCHSALGCFEQSDLPARAAMCHLLLARIALRADDAAEALRRCDRALARIARTASPMLAYQAHLLQGDALGRSGERVRAYASYEAARRALETLRSRLNDEELRIAFVRNRGAVYARLFLSCLDGSTGGRAPAEAFSHVEHAKSRALFELMFQPVHTLADAIESAGEHARSIRDLREQLNWSYHALEREQVRPGPRSPKHVAALRRDIEDRETDLRRLLRELKNAAPSHFDLHAPSVCSLDEIRAALPGEAVLVEYFAADDRIFVCLVDAQTVEVTPLTQMSHVADRLLLLQFQLSKARLVTDVMRPFRNALLKATQAHLRELFEQLLAPVWPRLEGRALVVVPHGALHYVPFHALFTGSQYVTESCTVSYAPSASIFTTCQQRPPGDGHGSLVLGIADTQAPLIEDEARAVATVLPQAELFLGADATEQVLRARGSGRRILHVASHGYFRPDSPMFSGIKLGDTYLNVYDLYGLRLTADLVTLSGCATGANVAAAGDELLGITRGLFSAGATTLLLSLWSAHDQSTTGVMTRFYRQLTAGATPPAALRHAMLEALAEYPHPFHWAPFIVTGKSTI